MEKTNIERNKLMQSVLKKSEGLQRGMKSRHVMMIAIGELLEQDYF